MPVSHPVCGATPAAGKRWTMLLHLCCLWLIQNVAGLCQFPIYLQTNVTAAPLSRHDLIQYRRDQLRQADDDDRVGEKTPGQRDWRSGVREQATDWSTTLTFDGGLMTVEGRTTPGPPAAASHVDDVNIILTGSVQYECVEQINTDRYLIRHQQRPSRATPHADVMTSYAIKRDEQVESISYACVQFIRRSASVVQLKISSSSSTAYNRTLCQDRQLRLEKWLMVDMAGLFRRPTSSREDDETGSGCPLVGGFIVRVFESGSRGDRDICDGRRRVGDTRVEAECSPGDGQYFYFRSTTCVPPGAYMYATQRTICRASWSDDVYTYVVLTHDRLRYAWLFRHPAVLVADSFSAHLLRDLAADDSPHAAWTGAQHWRLDMVRDVHRPVTSLCVDDMEACRTWSPSVACGGAASTALACPRTCSVCNESRPVVCAFGVDLVGDWLVLTDTGEQQLSVVVSDRTITMQSDGGVVEEFHCVTWTDERDGVLGEQMVVTEHSDGCRPRYSCVKYQRRAPALVQLKMSRPRLWPLIDAVDQPVDCRAFSYDDDDDDGRPSLRTRRFQLLYSRDPTEPTPCGLHLPGGDRSVRNYTMSYRDGTRCTNSSMSETPDGHAFRITVADCSPTVPQMTTTLFHCIKSSRLLTEDGVTIVSRTATDDHIRCWLYVTAHAQPEMYWLENVDCGVAVRRVASYSAGLSHVASLLPGRKAEQLRRQADGAPEVSTTATQRHLPANRRRDHDQPRDIATVGVPRHGSDIARTHEASSITPETEVENNAESSNVFVVFAAIVIFTLLQIPCNLCRT